MFSKLKQYKDMRGQAKDMQNSLSEETVHANVDDKIHVVMDGNHKIVSLEINEEYLKPENKEKLQKDIIEVMERAQTKVKQMLITKMRSGDLKMPDMSGMM